MQLLHIFLLGHVLSAGLAWAAPATAPESDNLSQEDLLHTNTTYMRGLLRESKVAEVMSFMNTKVDPCYDFYDFACGNYEHINSASALEVLSTGVFETVTKGLNRKIVKMLNKEHDRFDTPEDIQVKHFYESCKRLKELTAAYPEKMRKLIAEFGSMPVLEGSAWRESDFDWQYTTARMSNTYGIASIIGCEVSKDFASNERNRVYVGQQEFPLESRAMYESNATEIYREKYRNTIQRYLQRSLLVPKELAKRTAKELLDFEVDLAKGLVDESLDLNMNNLTTLLTVEEMHRLYAPTLDINRLVSVTLGERVTDQIYEYNRDYQKNLVEVMKRTPLRTVANYVFFRLIYEFVESPPSTPAKLQQQCVDLTKKFFAKNLDNMFYRRYNTEKSSMEIDNMWRQLKATFNESLTTSPQLNWISRSTRDLAIAKLQAMKLEVNSYADENFTEEFAGLNLQSGDYVENVRQTLLQSAKEMRGLLHKPAKPLEAGSQLSYTPANILVENVIKVPVALLQPFYIWADAYPNAVMFGTLASLIGHELIHGFDDVGRGFDASGNAHDWWDEQSSANFKDRRQCFTKQYGRYMYGGIQLKESTSQSENIADNGGMRLAYTAYRKWYDSQSSKPGGSQALASEQLPSLNYTGKQLFFISFAQIWCNDAHPNFRAMQVSTDQHMPGKIRVIGSLSNFGEFAEVFNCQARSPMNPEDKCFLY